MNTRGGQDLLYNNKIVLTFGFLIFLRRRTSTKSDYGDNQNHDDDSAHGTNDCQDQHKVIYNDNLEINN